MRFTFPHAPRSLRLLTATVALAALSTLASATTIDLYQQDFEAPNSGYGQPQCTGFEGNTHTAQASASYQGQEGVPYRQANTADRICITKVGSPNDITDPPPALAAITPSGFTGQALAWQ